MSGIFGGNAYGVVLLSYSDVAYREGSSDATIGGESLFSITAAQGMTAILPLGRLRREKHGIANIVAESAAILVVYAGVIGALVFAG